MQATELAPLHEPTGSTASAGTIVGGIELLNSFLPVFLCAFTVTLILTPLVRKLAVAAGVIDHPDQTRKEHSYPIAYLGGLAVFFGVLAGVAASYVMVRGPAADLAPLPLSVVVGMVAIAFTGLADDIWKWDPRLKIAGQLVAAAMLCWQDEFGKSVAQGLLTPLVGGPKEVLVTVAGYPIVAEHLYTWVGVAIVAIFVLGGCNAANLLDGLDGLLSGSVAIMAVGFLIISLLMGTLVPATDADNTLVAARVALSLALLGAVLGFLPYNFNPAVIFLGDAGSLMLGYLCVIIILMFGEASEHSEHPQTHLVVAGLIIFALPIMDTTLAMIRRKLAGVSFATADANHIHHQLKRSLGSVRKAVFALYGITALFTLLGVALAAMRLMTTVRVLLIYAVAFTLFAFIAAVAIKTARRGAWTIASRRAELAAAHPADAPGAAGAVAPGAAAAAVPSTPISNPAALPASSETVAPRRHPD